MKCISRSNSKALLMKEQVLLNKKSDTDSCNLKSNTKAQAMKVEDNHVKVVPAPVIFLIFIALGLILNCVLPLPSFTDVLAARVAGLLVICMGLFVGLSAIVQMRRVHSSPNPHKPATALVEAGVFRYTLNPLYLSLFILYIGIAICVNVLWLILLCPFLIWSVENWVVKPEEDYLERRFSDAYRQYKTRVRRWV